MTRKFRYARINNFSSLSGPDNNNLIAEWALYVCSDQIIKYSTIIEFDFQGIEFKRWDKGRLYIPIIKTRQINQLANIYIVC